MMVSISVEALLTELYATAALRASGNQGQQPARLRRSNEKALRRLAAPALAMVLAPLAKYAPQLGSSPSEDEPEILTVEFTGIPAAEKYGPQLRRQIERALFCELLARVYSGSNPGLEEGYESCRRDAVTAIMTMLGATESTDWLPDLRGWEI